MRKHLLTQTKARLKMVPVNPLKVGGKVKSLLGIQVAGLEVKTESVIAIDLNMADTTALEYIFDRVC